MRDKYVMAMLGAKPFQTAPVWQWDKGLVLTFPASSAAKLPESYEMHWSNDPRGTASVQIGNRDGVLIPDEYINTGRMVYGWVYVPNEDGSALTVYDIIIPVKQRARPTDYEPTPDEQTAIDQSIAALNAAVEKCESAIDKTPHPENGVWVVWNAVTGEWESTGISAQGPRGKQGEQGEPGSEYTVMVQETQPTERSNKIWIPGPDGQIVEVPTVEELNAKADKTDTVLDTFLSRGRKANKTVGLASFAFGQGVEASGTNSVAFGDQTVASGDDSFAEGIYTIANVKSMHACGSYNKPGTFYPEWVSGSHYVVGDRMKRTLSSGREIGYECIEENSDTTFTSRKWKVLPTSGDLAFAVGNGSSPNDRSNAMEIYWDGTVRAQTALQIGDIKITETQLQQLLALLS